MVNNHMQIILLVIITVTCSTITGTGVSQKTTAKEKITSIEPIDDADTVTNTTALERFRRLIPYMTYYLTQGVPGRFQFAQPLLQPQYNQLSPVNVVPNKLDPTQQRAIPLLNNAFLIRPLSQQIYNPQQQQQQPLQPLGLSRFTNYQQAQIMQNAPLPQQSHYSLPNKPLMEYDFKPLVKSPHYTNQHGQFIPKTEQQQQQYIIKDQRPQQLTLLQPATQQLPLTYPKTIVQGYSVKQPSPAQYGQQQIPLNIQRPTYIKTYQPHKALQQYLQEVTPVTKILPLKPIYTDAAASDYQTPQPQPLKPVYTENYHRPQTQPQPLKPIYTDAADTNYQTPKPQLLKPVYTDSMATDYQTNQAQQFKSTEDKNNQNVEQPANSYIQQQYMSNNERPNEEEVMTITQSQEIIVPQQAPQDQQQPDDATTLELTELLEGYKLSKSLPETITSANIGSSIRTLSQILKLLQRANALSTISHPADQLNKAEYHDDYSSRTLPYSSTQTEASTPGRAGVDYPNYSEIPGTAFNCKDQRYKGFFGDPETNCQVWHYCDLNGGQASFLCPNGTIFSQVALTCDWWFNVKCASTTQLYVLNERLYKYILPQRPSFPEDFSGPLVDQYLTLKYHELEAKKKTKNNGTTKTNTTTTTTETPTHTSSTDITNADYSLLQSLLTNEVKRNV